MKSTIFGDITTSIPLVVNMTIRRNMSPPTTGKKNRNEADFDCYLIRASSFFGLFCDTEDGAMLLQNVEFPRNRGRYIP
jgi:hypothetical protein